MWGKKPARRADSVDRPIGTAVRQASPGPEELPALYQFCAGYFNQDWHLDFATWEEVVTDFLEKNTKDHIEQTANELDHVLAHGFDDAALSTLLGRFDSFIRPEAFGLTVRDWLLLIRDRMRHHLADG